MRTAVRFFMSLIYLIFIYLLFFYSFKLFSAYYSVTILKYNVNIRLAQDSQKLVKKSTSLSLTVPACVHKRNFGSVKQMPKNGLCSQAKNFPFYGFSSFPKLIFGWV